VLTASADMPGWINNEAAHAGGDGTVPRASAVPLELSEEALATYLGERHGSLQRNEYVLGDFCERLRTMQAGGLEEFRGPIEPARQRRTIELQVEDLFLPCEPVLIRARMSDGGGLACGLVAEVTPAEGDPQEIRFRDGTDGWEVTLEGLQPGVYRVRVRSEMGGSAAPMPVRELFEVAEV
jgi:hypothetical protein